MTYEADDRVQRAFDEGLERQEPPFIESFP